MKFLFRKVQLFMLKQIESVSFGSGTTLTSSIGGAKGARVSSDDSYYIVPFQPLSNTDYKGANTALNYIGVITLATDVLQTTRVSLYNPATDYAMVSVDGEISPDNLRYYLMLRESTTYYGHILSLNI
jgi:hypothetical protein